jgi:adenine phosphoribosyltransferase
VLATGGTAQATASLVRRTSAKIVSIAVVIKLSFLGGRAKLTGEPLRTLVTV